MLISFGNIEKTLLFPLLYCISHTIRMQMLTKENNPFLINYLSCFAVLFLGILYPFKLCCKKKKNKIKHTLLTYIIIIIISILNTFFCLGIFFVEKQFKGNIATEIRFISIFYVFYWTHRIFKIQRSNHMRFVYLVMFICQICLSAIIVPITIIGETFQDDFSQSKVLYIVMVISSLLCDIFFSTKHIAEKYLMDINFVSPWKLLFLEGIVSFISNIGFNAIMLVPKCPKAQIGSFKCGKVGESIFKFQAMIEYLKTYYIECSIFFLCSIGIEFGMTMTNKIYFPTYRPIFDSIVTFLTFIISFIQEGKLSNNIEIIKILFYLIIVFACLVGNELIILHCCNLDKDIKDNIAEREKENFDGLMLDLKRLDHDSRCNSIAEDMSDRDVEKLI